MSTVHSAVKAVIKRGEHMLLLRQDVEGTPLWDVPGGRMQYGETAEQAIHREVMEETGLSIRIIRLLGVWQFFRRTDGDQVVCITYLCEPTTDTPVDLTKNDTGERIDRFEWVYPTDVRGPEFHSLPDGLRQILQVADL